MKEIDSKNFIQDYIQDEFNKPDSLIIQFGSSIVLIIVLLTFVLSMLIKIPVTINCVAMLYPSEHNKTHFTDDSSITKDNAAIPGKFSNTRIKSSDSKQANSSNLSSIEEKYEAQKLTNIQSVSTFSHGDSQYYSESNTNELSIELIVPSAAKELVKTGQRVDIRVKLKSKEYSDFTYVGYVKSINITTEQNHKISAFVEFKDDTKLVIGSLFNNIKEETSRGVIYIGSRSLFSKIFNN